MNFRNNILFECYEKCILMRFLFLKMFYHNIVGTADQSYYYSERNEKCIDLTTAWTMFFFSKLFKVLSTTYWKSSRVGVSQSQIV